ncbi:hypothetical protein STSO111631_22075 [Stackebrandtia soli]
MVCHLEFNESPPKVQMLWHRTATVRPMAVVVGTGILGLDRAEGAKLRAILEPDLAAAERTRESVLRLIRELMSVADDDPDSAEAEAKLTAARIGELTGKTVAPHSLLLAWEEEGEEVAAFRVSLPDPPVVADISRAELTEIVGRVIDPVFPDDESPLGVFGVYLGSWYRALLSRNFANYSPRLFNRVRGSDGTWANPTVAGVAEALWPMR